jgi:hypothetical protein
MNLPKQQLFLIHSIYLFSSITSSAVFKRWTFDVTTFKVKMKFVAFPATEYDEVLSGYQPGQMAERWKTAQAFDPADNPRKLHQTFKVLNSQDVPTDNWRGDTNSEKSTLIRALNCVCIFPRKDVSVGSSLQFGGEKFRDTQNILENVTLSRLLLRIS